MLKKKKLRITYNNYGNSWNMTNSGSMDTGTYEGYLMHTFTQKYQLQTEFLNANWQWGSFDEETKLWNGGVGNVCKTSYYVFGYLIPISPPLPNF